MDIVAEARAALAEYRETGKMPVLPQCDNIQHIAGVWKCVFEEEPNLDAWECLAIQENDQLLADCIKNDEKMFKIQALLACTIIQTYSTRNLSGGFISAERLVQWKQLFKQLQPKIAKAWAEAFNHPKFSELVIESSNLFSCLTQEDLSPFRNIR